MATAIGKHVDKLTRGAFSAHGFAYAQILTHWETIVGPQLAAVCAPSRLRWPQGQERLKDERRRLGGTLTVTVEGPAAIELQHDTPRIIERLNTFYGYQAIAEIRIVQGHLDDPGRRRERRVRAALTRERESELKTSLQRIDEQDLQDSLTRLGRGVLARSDKDKAQA
ncbi:MAG: DciA family protein [Pseudomonadota bacterium]